MAEQIMKTHNAVFANRPQLEFAKQILYGCRDQVFSPYGEHWRNLRKIFSSHLLRSRWLQTYELAREQEVAFLIHRIEKLSLDSEAPVDLSPILSEFFLCFISRLIHGKSIMEEGQHRVLHEAIDESIHLFSRFHVEDYFPSLRWMSSFTGFNSELQRTFEKWDQFLDGVIDKHLNPCRDDPLSDDEDSVDVVLALQKDSSTGFFLTMESIKAIMMDTLETTSHASYVALEWAVWRNSYVTQK